MIFGNKFYKMNFMLGVIGYCDVFFIELSDKI